MLVRKALAGLSYLHGKGVVHNDIKVENIFVNGGGPGGGPLAVKIIDFGCASPACPFTP